MKSIFIGMLFVFLNFDLNIGNASIGLIPNVIGYYFMLKGLSEMVDFSERFAKVIPIVQVMMVFSVITYVLALIGGSVNVDIQSGYYVITPLNWSMLAFGFVSVVISLYISYNIIMGIRDIELAQFRDLNVVQLYLLWKLKVLFAPLIFFIFIAPAIAIIGTVISFVIAVIYLFAFNKAKNLYYA